MGKIVSLLLAISLTLSSMFANDFNIIASKDSHIKGDIQVFINCYNQKYREALKSGKKFGPDNPIKNYMKKYENMDILQAFINQCDIPDDLLPPSDLNLLFKKFGNDFNVTDYKKNKVPLIKARGPIKTAYEYENVTLGIQTAKFMDPEPQRYIWEKISGPNPREEFQEGSTLHIQLPRYYKGMPKMIYKVTAIDGYGKSDYDIVSFKVLESPLSVDIGNDMEKPEESNVSINSIVSDRKNLPKVYYWEQISGPSVDIDNRTSKDIHFTLPKYTAGIQPIVLKLSVEDSVGHSASDTIKITVKSKQEIQNTINSTKKFTIEPQTIHAFSSQNIMITPIIKDDFGKVTNYFWEQTGGDNVTFLLGTRYEKSLILKIPDNTDTGSVKLKLTARDERGNKATQIFEIIIQKLSLSIDNIISIKDQEHNNTRQYPSITNNVKNHDKTLQYLWIQYSGEELKKPDGTSALPSTQKEIVFRNSPWRKGKQDSIYMLTVKNSEGRVAKKIITQKYTPKISEPLFFLNDKAVSPQETVTIQPTISNITPLSYRWIKVSGPNIDILENSKTKRVLKFKAPSWNANSDPVKIACIVIDDTGKDYADYAFIYNKEKPEESVKSIKIDGTDVNSSATSSLDLKNIFLNSNEEGNITVISSIPLDTYQWKQIYGTPVLFKSKTKNGAWVKAPVWSSKHDYASILLTGVNKNGDEVMAISNILQHLPGEKVGQQQEEDAYDDPKLIVQNKYAPPNQKTYITYWIKNQRSLKITSINIEKKSGSGEIKKESAANVFYINTPEKLEDWNNYNQKIDYHITIELDDNTTIQADASILPMVDKSIELHDIVASAKIPQHIEPQMSEWLNESFIKNISWSFPNQEDIEMTHSDLNGYALDFTITNWKNKSNMDLNLSITFKDNTTESVSAKINKPNVPSEYNTENGDDGNGDDGGLGGESVSDEDNDNADSNTSQGSIKVSPTIPFSISVPKELSGYEGSLIDIPITYLGGEPVDLNITQIYGIVSWHKKTNLNKIKIKLPVYSNSSTKVGFKISATSNSGSSSSNVFYIRVIKSKSCSADIRDVQCLIRNQCKKYPTSEYCIKYCSKHMSDEYCSIDFFSSDSYEADEGSHISIIGLDESQRKDRYSYFWEQLSGTHIDKLEYKNNFPYIDFIVPKYDNADALMNEIHIKFTVSTDLGGETHKEGILKVLKVPTPLEKFLKKCFISESKGTHFYHSFFDPETGIFDNDIRCTGTNIDDNDLNQAALELKEITGNLIINNNERITSLNFLKNIKVDKSISFKNCGIDDLSGLTNKNSSIKGSLILSQNKISNLVPLTQLSEVNGVFDLSHNRIGQLDGLDGLSKVTDDFFLENNPYDIGLNISTIKDLTIPDSKLHIKTLKYTNTLPKESNLCNTYFNLEAKRYICPHRTKTSIINDFVLYSKIPSNYINNETINPGSFFTSHALEYNPYSGEALLYISNINTSSGFAIKANESLSFLQNMRNINGTFKVTIDDSVTDESLFFLKDLNISEKIRIEGRYAPKEKLDSDTNFCKNVFEQGLNIKSKFCKNAINLKSILSEYCTFNGHQLPVNEISNFYNEDNGTITANLKCNIPVRYNNVTSLSTPLKIYGDFYAEGETPLSGITEVFGDMVVKEQQTVYPQLTFVQGNLESDGHTLFPALLNVGGTFFPLPYRMGKLPANDYYLRNFKNLRSVGKLVIKQNQKDFSNISDLSTPTVSSVAVYPDKTIDSNSTLCQANFSRYDSKIAICGTQSLAELMSHRCQNLTKESFLNNYNQNNHEYNGSLNCSFRLEDLPILSDTNNQITEINGDLFVSGEAGTLPYLNTVKGNVVIESKMGLPTLEYISGNLDVKNDGDGLESIKEINGSLSFPHDDIVGEAVTHLISLSKVSVIYLNDYMHNLSVLSDTNVTNYVAQRWSEPKLIHTLAEDSIFCQSKFQPESLKTHICKNITLKEALVLYCDANKNTIDNDFNETTGVYNGNLYCRITTEQSDAIKDKDLLKQINGSLIAKYNTYFPALKKVTGIAKIYDSTSLPKLEEVSEFLYIDTHFASLKALKSANNVATNSLQTTPNLEYVTGDLNITESETTNDLKYLSHLKQVGNLRLQRGTIFENFSHLKNLVVNGEVSYSKSQKSIPALDYDTSLFCKAKTASYRTLYSQMLICNKIPLRNFIVNHCDVNYNEFNSSFDQTNQTFNGDLKCTFQYSKSFFKIDNIENFKTIDGNFNTNQGLPYLEDINGSLLLYTTKIKDDFPRLQKVTGSLEFHKRTTEISFPKLEYIGGALDCGGSNYYNYKRICNFPSLLSVGDLTIPLAKPNFKTITNFKNLKSITHSLNVNDPNENWADGFSENLKNIGENLSVTPNNTSATNYYKFRNLNVGGIISNQNNKAFDLLDSNSTFCKNKFPSAKEKSLVCDLNSSDIFIDICTDQNGVPLTKSDIDNRLSEGTYHGSLICNPNLPNLPNLPKYTELFNIFHTIDGNLTMKTSYFKMDNLTEITGALKISNISHAFATNTPKFPKLKKVGEVISTHQFAKDSHTNDIEWNQEIFFPNIEEIKSLNLDNYDEPHHSFLNKNLISGLTIKTNTLSILGTLPNWRGLENIEFSSFTTKLPHYTNTFQEISNTSKLCQSLRETNEQAHYEICDNNGSTKGYLMSACEITEAQYNNNFNEATRTYNGDLTCNDLFSKNILSDEGIKEINGNLTIKLSKTSNVTPDISLFLEKASKIDILTENDQIKIFNISNLKFLFPKLKEVGIFSGDMINAPKLITADKIKINKGFLNTPIIQSSNIVELNKYNSKTVANVGRDFNISNRLIIHNEYSTLDLSGNNLETVNAALIVSSTGNYNLKNKFSTNTNLCQSNFTSAQARANFCYLPEENSTYFDIMAVSCGFKSTNDLLKNYDASTQTYNGSLSCDFLKNNNLLAKKSNDFNASNVIKTVNGNYSLKGVDPFVTNITGALTLSDPHMLNETTGLLQPIEGNISELHLSCAINNDGAGHRNIYARIHNITNDLYLYSGRPCSMDVVIDTIGGSFYYNNRYLNTSDIYAKTINENFLPIYSSNYRYSSVNIFNIKSLKNTVVNGTVKDSANTGSYVNFYSQEYVRLDNNTTFCQNSFQSNRVYPLFCISTSDQNLTQKDILTEFCHINKNQYDDQYNDDTQVFSGNLNCDSFDSTNKPKLFNKLLSNEITFDIKEINGSLTTEGLVTFPSLEKITGNLTVNTDPHWVNKIALFPKLFLISGNFTVTANNTHNSSDPTPYRKILPSLRTIEGDLTLSGYYGNSVFSFPALKQIKGVLNGKYIGNNWERPTVNAIFPILGSEDINITKIHMYGLTSDGHLANPAYMQDLYKNFPIEQIEPQDSYLIQKQNKNKKFDKNSPFCKNIMTTISIKSEYCDLTPLELLELHCNGFSPNNYNSETKTYNGNLTCSNIQSDNILKKLNGDLTMKSGTLKGLEEVNGSVSFYYHSYMGDTNTIFDPLPDLIVIRKNLNTQAHRQNLRFKNLKKVKNLLISGYPKLLPALESASDLTIGTLNDSANIGETYNFNKLTTLNRLSLFGEKYYMPKFPKLRNLNELYIGSNNQRTLENKDIFPELASVKKLLFHGQDKINKIKGIEDINVSEEGVFINSNVTNIAINEFEKAEKNSSFCTNSVFQTQELKNRLCSESPFDQNTIQEFLSLYCDKNVSVIETNYNNETKTYNGDLSCNFSSQAAVPHFKESLENDLLKIKGNITIDGSESKYITSLKEVVGNVIIRARSTGLPKLQKVDGNITVLNNGEGLGDLEDVTGDFTFGKYGYHYILPNFHKLKHIGGNLKNTDILSSYYQQNKFLPLSDLVVDGSMVLNRYSNEENQKLSENSDFCKNKFNSIVHKNSICQNIKQSEYLMEACGISKTNLFENYNSDTHTFTGNLSCETDVDYSELNIKNDMPIETIEGNLTVDKKFKMPSLIKINGDLTMHKGFLSNLDTINGNLIFSQTDRNSDSIDLARLSTVTKNVTVSYIYTFEELKNLKFVGGDFIYLPTYSVTIPDSWKDLYIEGLSNLKFTNRVHKFAEEATICQNKHLGTLLNKSNICKLSDTGIFLIKKCNIPEQEVDIDYNKTNGYLTLISDIQCDINKQELQENAYPGMSNIKKILGGKKIKLTGYTNLSGLVSIDGDLEMRDNTKTPALNNISGDLEMTDQSESGIKIAQGNVVMSGKSNAANLKTINGSLTLSSAKPTSVTSIGQDMIFYINYTTQNIPNITSVKEINGSLDVIKFYTHGDTYAYGFESVKDLKVANGIHIHPAISQRNKLDENTTFCSNDWKDDPETKAKVCDTFKLKDLLVAKCDITDNDYELLFDKASGEYNGSLRCSGFDKSVVSSISDINNFKKITGSLTIIGGVSFPYLQEIGEDLIEDVTNSSTPILLPALKIIGRNADIISKFGLPSLTLVKGNLIVRNFQDAFSPAQYLQKLESVNRNLKIISGKDDMLQYLSNLKYVGENLDLSNYGTVKKIPDDLTVDGKIIAYFYENIQPRANGTGNFCLSDFSDFANFSKTFWKNRACSSLSMREVLEDECGISEQTFDSNLDENGTYHGDIICNMYKGVSEKIRDSLKITKIDGSLELRGYGSLKDLISVSGNVALYDHSSAPNINAIGESLILASDYSTPSLRNIGGNLDVYSTKLRTNKLKSVEGDVVFHQNTNDVLASLPEIETIGGLLRLRDSGKIKIPGGLDKLSVADIIDIRHIEDTPPVFASNSNFCQSEFEEDYVKEKICSFLNIKDLLINKCGADRNNFESRYNNGIYNGSLLCYFTDHYQSITSDINAFTELNGSLTLTSGSLYIQKITGDLSIERNGKLPELTLLKGNLYIQSGSGVEIPKLKNIIGNATIDNDAGLPSLETITGELKIYKGSNTLSKLREVNQLTIASENPYNLRSMTNLTNVNNLVIYTKTQDFMPIKDAVVQEVHSNANESDVASGILLPKDSNLCKATFYPSSLKDKICE